MLKGFPCLIGWIRQTLCDKESDRNTNGTGQKHLPVHKEQINKTAEKGNHVSDKLRKAAGEIGGNLRYVMCQLVDHRARMFFLHKRIAGS